MARQTWVDGSVIYRVHVVEVMMVQKGFPKKSMGWQAKIVVGDVEVVTTKYYPTQKEAERAVCDACNKLFAQEG
jgi:hypothetical protein